MPEIRPEFGEFAAAQWTRTALCRLLRDYLHTAHPVPAPIRVGTDVVFYYDPADRLARVTPDLYVMEGIGPEEQLRSFRTWERNRVPELVVHLIDVAISPEDGLMMHFFRLGVQDVVLYDPLWFLQPGYLQPFFTDPLGQMFFGSTIGLLALCFFIVRQMIDIDI